QVVLTSESATPTGAGIMFSKPGTLVNYHTLYLNSSDNSLRFSSYPTVGSWDDRVTFTRDGRVGIGNTNPSKALDVSGVIKSSDLVLAETAGATVYPKVIASATSTNGQPQWVTFRARGTALNSPL